jgi:inner membrane protein
MHQPGHLGGALLCGAPGVAVLGVFVSPIAAGMWLCCLIGTASLPDIDQKLPIPHRGPTHSVVFVVGASLVLGGLATAGVRAFSTSIVAETLLGDEMLSTLSVPVVAATTVGGCLVGLTSHLLVDALTVGRGRLAVHPLWPISKRPLRFGFTTADSTIWNYGLLATGLLACAGALLPLF